MDFSSPQGWQLCQLWRQYALSPVSSDIVRKFKTEYAAPTELKPMRMINYKDAAPTALWQGGQSSARRERDEKFACQIGRSTARTE